MNMLHELCNPEEKKYIFTCVACLEGMDSGYQCLQCKNFTLCNACFNQYGHPHATEKLGIDVEVESVSDVNVDSMSDVKVGSVVSLADFDKESFWNANKPRIERSHESLKHAAKCLEVNCRYPNCQKMKQTMHHFRICGLNSTGNCTVCNKLTALIQYHAKLCLVNCCMVPNCWVSKLNLQPYHGLTNGEDRKSAGLQNQILIPVPLMPNVVPARHLRLDLQPGPILICGQNGQMIMPTQESKPLPKAEPNPTQVEKQLDPQGIKQLQSELQVLQMEVKMDHLSLNTASDKQNPTAGIVNAVKIMRHPTFLKASRHRPQMIFDPHFQGLCETIVSQLVPGASGSVRPNSVQKPPAVRNNPYVLLPRFRLRQFRPSVKQEKKN